MYHALTSNKRAFTAEMLFQNKTAYNQLIQLVARDMYKPYTLYTDRKISLTPMQSRKITLMFPESPDMMEVYAYNVIDAQNGEVNPHAKDFTYDTSITGITAKVSSCDLWIDQETADFVEFAQWFSRNAGLLSLGAYKSRSGQYTIKYIPYLTYTEKYTQRIVKSNSPSRVGWETGNIEVSQEHFMAYSIPKRFIILMHEWAHKYGNPKIKREINDESAADFLALYVYMSKGYPRIDAKDVFTKIFYGNPTIENKKRLNLILKFMEDFDSGKINNLVNCKSK